MAEKHCSEILLTCSKCKKEKPIDEFRRRPDRPETGKRLGRWSSCKQCEKEYSQTPHGRESSNKRTKKFLDRLRANNPAELRRRARATELKIRYGITAEDYQAMVDAQNGVCAICGKPPTSSVGKKLHIDHDHETGQMRELLCGPCNISLGGFNDSVELLISAIQYLKRHKFKLVSPG